MRRIILGISFLILLIHCSYAQTVKPWSEKMAATAISLWGPGSPTTWTYEKGLILKALEKVYERTNDVTYYNQIKQSIDYFVTNTGTINTYNASQYNIDHINMGRSLIFLFNQTQTLKYKTAAQKLRAQLSTHPRTTDGGFWHKQVYPNQMWLDGLYMAQPFYTEYSVTFSESNYDDIAKQIIQIEQHARDAKTGLLYHGWDESKQQKWADPVTGCSPNFWGRSLGWYAMSLVDVLENYPTTHVKRDTFVNILRRLSTALVKYQDPTTGLWYQVVDKATVPGNYLEASGSSMFVYALAKGYRKGYLDKSMLDAALKGYDGIIKRFVSEKQGVTHLDSICKVAGLGGSPYRDGTFAYYISEPVVTDDPKGVGAFILASVEIETAKESIPTGLNYKEDHSISVSPNPVTNILKITSTNPADNATVIIQNTLGQSIYEGSDKTIDASGWPTGIYHVKVIGSQGAVYRKILKQ